MCDVQSWNPSASEEISRASLDLRQFFNEEPDKMVKSEFRFTPSPSSSLRARRGGGSLRHENEFSKSGLTILKRGSRATGKPGYYFVQRVKTPRLQFIESVQEYSYEQTVRIYMLTRAGR